MASRPGGGDPATVIVSNRGPVSFQSDPDGGEPRPVRGAGGLVSGLGPLVRGSETIWIAAAMTAGDRQMAGGVAEAEGFRVRLLDIDRPTWSAYYDTVCNEALWFAHHGLFDPVYAPAWPAGWADGPWAAYRQVNEAFAVAVAEEAPDGATVAIQDYHLCLVAPTLRTLRPDLRLVHFSHTPFSPAAWLRMLPVPVVCELLGAMAAHDACGFHSSRWEADYLDSCRANGIEPAPTFVAPLGPDPDDLAATVASAATIDAGRDLDRAVGERQFLVRVDRIELSKNVLRGFEAYEALLEREPSRRGTVVFGAFVYPSRQGVAAYDTYARAVRERVDAINERFGDRDWTPILYDDRDDYPRSMAALARADVVLVNPIRDGLNLVAKEAMVINRRHGQLVLSPEAGAWDELGDAGAWRADPFDVGATAQALAAALDVDGPERVRRAETLRSAAAARTPADWLADQVAAARR